MTTLGRQVEVRPEMAEVLTSGWGAGGSDPAGWPNVLRLIVGETYEDPEGSSAREVTAGMDRGPEEFARAAGR